MKVVAILTLGFLSISSPSSFSAVIYSSNWNASTGIGFGINSNYWAAHLFSAATSETISTIELFSSSSSTIVRIRANNAGSPGAVLSTFSYVSSSGGNPLYSGTFTSTAGQNYWLSLEGNTSFSIRALQTISDVSVQNWNSGGVVKSTTDGGVTWGTGSVGGYNYFAFRMSSANQRLVTPNLPQISNVQNTSLSVSETSSTANAVNYTLKLYQSNGTTLIETKTVSTITSPTSFSNLSPGTTYKIGVVSNGDGTSYDNSLESPLATATTSANSTIVIVGSSSVNYGTSAPYSVTVTGGDGKVTFLANGKKVPSCIAKPTVSLTATCSFRARVRGQVTLTAVFTPTSGLVSGSTSSLRVLVSSRSNKR
jgi:hypothetical protein